MNNDEVQRQFFETIFGDNEGVVCLGTRSEDDVKKVRRHLYKYPEQVDKMIDYISQANNTRRDVYFCPDLFKPEAIIDKKVTKEYVQGSRVIPVDFDGNAPQNPEDYLSRDLPEPTIVLQSSGEYNKHVFWVFDQFVTDIPLLEAQRRIFTNKTDGDNSGWDAGGLFRVPGTTNWGWGKNRAPMDVLTEDINEKRYDFTALPEPTKRATQQVVYEALAREINSGAATPSVEKILSRHTFSEDFQQTFFMDASETNDRSRSLVRLANGAIESGCSDLEAYVLVRHTDDRWKKYTRRNEQDRIRLYSDCIERARANQDTAEIRFADDDDEGPDVAPQTSFTLAEILAYSVHIEWYFEGLLSTKGYGLLTGPPGVGKTQLALRMAEAVCVGSGFFSWTNSTARKGKALIFSMEMDVEELQYFLQRMEMPVDEISQSFIALCGMDFMPLDDPHGQAAFERELDRHRPDLVIIDSLNKVMKKSTSDDEAVRHLNMYLKKMRKKYKFALVIIHHTKKPDAGRRTLLGLEDVHGAVFIGSEADTAIVMQAFGSDIVINPVKTRLGRKPEPFIVNRTPSFQFEMTEKTIEYDRGIKIVDSPSVELADALGYGGDGDGTMGF